MRDTGIEPVTSSVSGKRSPAELNAHNRLKKETRADDETRTRDPHLGKVMRYQLRYIRTRHFRGARKNISPKLAVNTNQQVSRQASDKHCIYAGTSGEVLMTTCVLRPAD